MAQKADVEKRYSTAIAASTRRWDWVRHLNTRREEYPISLFHISYCFGQLSDGSP
jgi:hypothetical protein